MTNSILGTDEDPNPWMADIRLRFPDWRTDKARKRWPQVEKKLFIGQSVTGQVIAFAPFGIWLDIGVSFPALLLIDYRTVAFDGSPVAIGAEIIGRVHSYGDGGVIGITQRDPDFMIEGEDETIRRRLAKRIMDFLTIRQPKTKDQ